MKRDSRFHHFKTWPQSGWETRRSKNGVDVYKTVGGRLWHKALCLCLLGIAIIAALVSYLLAKNSSGGAAAPNNEVNSDTDSKFLKCAPRTCAKRRKP